LAEAQTELTALKAVELSLRGQLEKQKRRVIHEGPTDTAAVNASDQFQDPLHSSSREPFPWEISSTTKPGTWLPYWGESQEAIQWLEEQGRKALRTIPTQIYNSGERLKARAMREWIESEPMLINELSEELAGRIISTKRSERRSKKQKDDLALLALRDSIEYLKKKSDALTATQFDRYHDEHADKYEQLAREFVDAVADYYFKDR
jgi:hypothetical protein